MKHEDRFRLNGCLFPRKEKKIRQLEQVDHYEKTGF